MKKLILSLTFCCAFALSLTYHHDKTAKIAEQIISTQSNVQSYGHGTTW